MDRANVRDVSQRHDRYYKVVDFAEQDLTVSWAFQMSLSRESESMFGLAYLYCVGVSTFESLAR
jgi:hypothetical protein